MSGKPITTEEFIRQSEKVHGKKYDYSKVNYINNHTNINIICKLHGTFLQTPYKHLIGRGCQICGGSKKSNKKEFIEKAKKIHGDYYSYEFADYVNNSTKVKIICPVHNEYQQRPQDHINGQGCPKCVGKNKTTEEFVKKANKIHNNKYNYSRTHYKNSKQKVIIICPEHGEFYQIPDGHVNGKKGCPRCHSIISKQEEEFLNSLNIPNTKENRQIKILRKRVDGFFENTVYEFLGDYWHGNPNIFKPNEMNYHCKKLFKDLYNETIQRFNILKENGYIIKYIWENDWENWNKNGPVPLKEFTTQHI